MKQWIKKGIALVCGLAFFAMPLITVFAEQDKTTISVFVREGCAHCEDEKEFLDSLTQEMPSLSVMYYDLEEPKNSELFEQITDQYNISKGTPITLVNNTILSGFGTADTTGETIRQLTLKQEKSNTQFEDIINGEAAVYDVYNPETVCDESGCYVPESEYVVTIPIVGTQIDVSDFSLSILSFVLGFIDGFNPCALWVLIMFLVILTQVGSKKKMWQYAGIFILAEAIMYYFILTVWFSAWDFIGLNEIVTPLIGVLAVGSGVYFIYKFATYKPECSVIGAEKRSKITEKVKAIAKKPFSIGVFIGILGVAFSVNIFEFACSIGIPQTYTKILELNDLSWWVRQWYMFIYIGAYMIDDILIFGLALWGFDKIGLTHKYSKWSTLIGGVLMILLGLLLLFKPEALVF
ncbi:glutaredoxin [Patescibacteria group bacterium]|nr:glutaredoxin [Patescibacteria group bacterium]